MKNFKKDKLNPFNNFILENNIPTLFIYNILIFMIIYNLS